MDNTIKFSFKILDSLQLCIVIWSIALLTKGCWNCCNWSWIVATVFWKWLLLASWVGASLVVTVSHGCSFACSLLIVSFLDTWILFKSKSRWDSNQTLHFCYRCGKVFLLCLFGLWWLVAQSKNLNPKRLQSNHSFCPTRLCRPHQWFWHSQSKCWHPSE